MANSITQSLTLLSLPLLLLMGGCSDDGTTTPSPADIPTVDVPLSDVVPADTIPQDAGVDTAEPADSNVPDVAVTDTVSTDVGADAVQADSVADNTPPTVASTTPSDDEGNVALPFLVEVVFDEPIAANTIAAQTFRVIGPDNVDVPGERKVSQDGLAVTFTPAAEAELHYVSPYRVWVSGGIVSDLAGNKLEGNFEATFYTGDYPNTAEYKTLATAYAPTLNLATIPGVGTAQLQVPVAFNADGDWDGSNNKTWIQTQAQELLPTVYYDVFESQTHYFIHYLFFFPWVNHTNDSYAHANGASGAMVVVEKERGGNPERPIGVTTYFKKGQYEEHYAYVTTESGIKGDGSNTFYNLMGVYPQDELFPFGQYEALITAGRHESCLFIHKDLSLNCEFEVPHSLVVKASEVPYAIKKTGASWPKDMSELENEPEAISYILANAVTELWVRRDKIGENQVWDGLYTYKSGAGQPVDGLELPRQFVDPFDDLDASFGRPIWAWRHNPSQGNLTSVVDGEMGVDPANYYMTMHKSVNGDTSMVPYDPATGTGFSTQYCFNPILGIDKRDFDPACGADN